MNRCIKVFLVFCCCANLNVAAQNDDFQEFRNKAFADFDQFRNRILTDYDKYLQGIWERFQGKAEEKPNDKPGPETPPVYVEPPKDTVTTVPVVPLDIPVPTIAPIDNPDANVPTIKPVKPIMPPTSYVDVQFYDLEIKLPHTRIAKLKGSENENIAQTWGQMKTTISDNVIQAIQYEVGSMGLNGWFTLELVMKYINVIGSKNTPDERVIAEQYILTKLGYDVRLAKNADNDKLLMLVPFNEKMYFTVYLEINGQRYYTICDETNKIDHKNPPALYTCALPKDSALGENLSLLLNDMRIDSGDYQDFKISDGRITITGSVNKSLMEMLRHYPAMNIPEYAQSSVLPDLRQEIIKQIRPQIDGMSKLDAVNALLHFVQYGFQYADDGSFHGYEKYYFFEENLYYPKNDCEDRAIFFGYLVKELLGLHVQLIGYPEHESSAVRFIPENVSGDSYTCKDQRWIISDATYLGAKAGACMPQYKTIIPDIDFEY